MTTSEKIKYFANQTTDELLDIRNDCIIPKDDLEIINFQIRLNGIFGRE